MIDGCRRDAEQLIRSQGVVLILCLGIVALIVAAAGYGLLVWLGWLGR